MRQILIRVPRGEGEHVLDVAHEHDGSSLSLLEGRDDGGNVVDVVVAHLPNRQVGPFIDALGSIEDLHLAMPPQGMLLLQPPASQTPDQVIDVTDRSPIEVFLAGLQSIGSWKGFLGYAIVAGIVAWLGMFTNTSYLLVGAMLIAPFGGPAVNAAIASARGDLDLLWHALLRYVVALAVAIVTAAILTLAFRQDVPTQTMADISNISTAAFLLPLVAGAAGAVNLSQSERSSLVSGAAVGMLVAASLAPPAALIGMSAMLGRWDMAKSGVFLLVLQLVGINLAGAIVFRLFGLGPEGPRYDRGRTPVAWLSGALTVVALAVVLGVQFGSNTPEFRRATIEQRIRSTIGEEMEGMTGVQLVSSTVRFTRADISGQDTVIIEIYGQRNPDAADGADELERQVTRRIQQVIVDAGYGVTPLVDVTVLEPPEAASN